MEGPLGEGKQEKQIWDMDCLEMPLPTGYWEPEVKKMVRRTGVEARG